MDQVREFFSELLSTASWPARWHCGVWSDFHGYLYAFCSVAIWAAYFFIPIIIFYVVVKRKGDLPFPKLFSLFSLFILSCGITHCLDAIMFWSPLYRLQALLLFITCVISWYAVWYLYKILPYVLSFTSPKELERIVEQRTNELAIRNSDLMKLNREMDNFVYSTSHDLKSPINNITGLVNILRMELPKGNTTIDDLLERIESSSSRAIDAIQNLTGILKIHAEPYDDLESINIQVLIEEILEENTILVKDNQVEVIYSLGVTHVLFSRTALKSILYNLINNAIKYRSPERQPEITISTFWIATKLVGIDVADNGLGIDLERYGEKVFTLFKRFHDHIDGSGIGLYSVRKIIEMKGGSISVASEMNKGSVFKLIIPQ